MATPRQTRSVSRGTTPLPAVDTRQSHAYGAKGKAALRNQVVTSTTTNFAEAFTTGREASTARTIPEESEPGSPSPSVAPSLREGTVVESMAHYEDERIPARPRSLVGRIRPTPRAARQVSPPSAPPVFATVPRSPPRSAARNVPTEAAEPWNAMVLLLAIPRYLWRNLWTLWLGGLIFGLLLVLPLPHRVHLAREKWIGGQKMSFGWSGYSEPPSELERLWLTVRYRNVFAAEDIPYMFNLSDFQWQANLMFLNRIEKVETRLDYLESNITALKNDIPHLMVVDIVDGQQVIRPEFWAAIHGKMAGDTPLWNAFLAANEETVTQVTQQAFKDGLDHAINNQVVLDSETFKVLMDEHMGQLLYNLQQSVGEATENMQRESREIVKTAVSELTENSPRDAKEKSWVTNRAIMLQNTYQSLSNVNHLSQALGARIDAHYTSPSLKVRRHHGSSWWKHTTNVIYSPPVMAILKGDEMGECWCAAHSAEHGKAQLAIDLNHNAYPNQIYIEHIPAPGPLGISAAPKEFEVWAEAADAEQADLFRAKVAAYCEDFAQKPYGCIDSTPPTETAVCIAQGAYDIHLDNWTQQWGTIIDTKEIGFMTRKVYFRFTSNWGAEHTCIYRVRLGGHEMDESDPHYYG